MEEALEQLDSLRGTEITPREALLLPHPSGVSQRPSREGLPAVPCPCGRRPKQPKTFRAYCGPWAPASPSQAMPPEGPGLLQRVIMHLMNRSERNKAADPISFGPSSAELPCLPRPGHPCNVVPVYVSTTHHGFQFVFAFRYFRGKMQFYIT